jgi:DivIVA domain-containing protein
MDLTPQELRGSEIKEAFRGYHRDEVDDLLERAAGTIEKLQQQVDEAGSRPADPRGPQASREDAETIQRTLLLAQRAADDAVRDAETRAHQIVGDAEARAQAIVGDAESNARRIADGERRRLESEINELTGKRDQLVSDADALDEYVDGYRDRVRAAIEADLAALGSTRIESGTRPELHEIPDGPRLGTGLDLPTAVFPEPADVSSEPAGAPAHAGNGGGWTPPARTDLPTALTSSVPDSPEAEWPPRVAAAEEPEAYEAPADVDEPRPFASEEPMEAQAIDSDALDDDAFFASLRDAVHDETPLGPVDSERSPFFDAELETNERRRFRRR